MLTYKQLELLLEPIQHEQPESEARMQSGPINNKQQSSVKNKPSQEKPSQSLALINMGKEVKKGKQQQSYSLKLSHRQLRKAPTLIPFKQYQIEALDLSFNYLKQLKTLIQQPSPHLNYLNLSFNFLTSIHGIGAPFRNLQVLDACANRIESVQISDEEFPVLSALYLKNNKIRFFMSCPNSVEILCLDHNQLKKLAFRGGFNLQILSASANKIEEFEIQSYDKLNFLDLEQNLFHDLDLFKKTLSKCQNLICLNMIGNLVSKVSHKRYLVEVLTTCPKLVKVDEVMINPHVREAFKVLAEQDKLQATLQETEQRYYRRMEEQLKLKQELIDRLKKEEQAIEDNFTEFLRNEKQQLDSLQSFAKNNLGKKKFAIQAENTKLAQVVEEYNQGSNPYELGIESKVERGNTVLRNDSSVMNGHIEGQLRDYLTQGVVMNKNQDEYLQYQKNKNQSQSKLQKQVSQGIEQQPGSEEDSNEGGQEAGKLNQIQIDRRRKNMSNPDLIYRNSNELLGVPVSIIEEAINSAEDSVFNKKCIPYLGKNYGFHTLI